MQKIILGTQERRRRQVRRPSLASIVAQSVSSDGIRSDVDGPSTYSTNASSLRGNEHAPVAGPEIPREMRIPSGPIDLDAASAMSQPSDVRRVLPTAHRRATSETVIGFDADCGSDPLHVGATLTHEPPSHAHEANSSSCGTGLRGPALTHETAVPSIIASPPFAQPSSPAPPTQPPRRAPRPGQTRRRTRSAAPMSDNRGAPDTYVSLGPCNRVCRHCKALFWYEEWLKHGSA